MHVLAVAAFVISDLRFSGRVRQASHRLRLVTDDTKRFFLHAMETDHIFNKDEGYL